jgi:hypothetical protein
MTVFDSPEAAAVAGYPAGDVGVDRVHYSDDGVWAGVYLIVNGWYQMFAECVRNETGHWDVISEQSGHPAEELLRIPGPVDAELQGARVLRRASITEDARNEPVSVLVELLTRLPGTTEGRQPSFRVQRTGWAAAHAVVAVSASARAAASSYADPVISGDRKHVSPALANDPRGAGALGAEDVRSPL